MNRSRSGFYGNSFTPQMFTNGKDSEHIVNNWISHPKQYIGEISLYDISISGTQSGNDISFTVRSTSLQSVDSGDDIRLFIATVMGQVMYDASPNGLRDHHDAVIELVPGNTGKKIDYIAGVEYEETIEWSMPDNWINHADITWKSEDLKVVVWIQDYSSKKVLQVMDFDFE